jgi:Tfp pilus assembly PilM family ATPase
MLSLIKSRPYSIGVDLGDDALKLVQLAEDTKGLTLVAGRSECRPKDIEPRTGHWQKWAIDAMGRLTANGGFRGKDVTATIPPNELHIEHMRMPKKSDTALQTALFGRIKQKLPFEASRENTLIDYIPTEGDNVMVLAAERAIIDRHLAIYEKAGLHAKSIGAWPAAIATCYARFFGRRRSDLDAVVMLLCIEPNCTNIVISRHKSPLFAHSISIGCNQLADEQNIGRFVLELTGCRRHFSTIYRDTRIERLIFLAGHGIERETCADVAKQLEIPAQMGDCLAAIQIVDPRRLGIDRRSPAAAQVGEVRRQKQVNWATAFGLCLAQN